MTFDLGWPLKIKSGNWVFIGLYLLNSPGHDQSLYEKHIVSHMWYFSWPHYLWPWMTYKGQIKYNWVFNGLYLLYGACYNHILHETHIGSHIHVYGLSVDLMIFELDDLWCWMIFKGSNWEIWKWILSNIWINFTFGKLFTWTGKNNGNMWLPIGYTSDSEQCSNRL